MQPGNFDDCFNSNYGLNHLTNKDIYLEGVFGEDKGKTVGDIFDFDDVKDWINSKYQKYKKDKKLKKLSNEKGYILKNKNDKIIENKVALSFREYENKKVLFRLFNNKRDKSKSFLMSLFI